MQKNGEALYSLIVKTKKKKKKLSNKKKIYLQKFGFSTISKVIHKINFFLFLHFFFFFFFCIFNLLKIFIFAIFMTFETKFQRSIDKWSFKIALRINWSLFQFEILKNKKDRVDEICWKFVDLWFCRVFWKNLKFKIIGNDF